MSQILVRRKHGLPLGQVRRLAEAMAKQLRDDLGGSYAWDGDTLRFRRTGASGHVAVTRDEVEIRVDLSLLLRPFHTRIAREIETFCDAHVRDGAAQPRPVARSNAPTRSSRSQGASRSARPK